MAKWKKKDAKTNTRPQNWGTKKQKPGMKSACAPEGLAIPALIETLYILYLYEY
jgi:hypothetical protein